MSILSDLLVGKQESTTASTNQSGTAQRKPADPQLYSLLLRNLLGQAAKPPNTAISVPMQQAISGLQGMQIGPHVAPGTGSGAGMGNQWGMQSREQLGLPDRASYNPLGVTLDDLKSIGTAPVQANKQGLKLRKQANRAERKGQDAKAARLKARE